MVRNTIKQIAQENHNAGYWIVPTNGKVPIGGSWKSESKPEKVVDSFGIACGSLSGGIECLDFDNKFGDVVDIVDEFTLDEQVAELYLEGKIVIESTPSGGYHFIFKSDFYEGNLKLATQTRNGKTECVIETRGDGGYFVVSPSDGYDFIHLQDEEGNEIKNDITKLVKLTEAERKYLINKAYSYNQDIQKVYHQPIQPPKEVKANIIEIYNQDPNSKREALGLLEGLGWQFREKRYGKGYDGLRPGKDWRDGISATFGYVADNVFYVFSSSCEYFEPNKAYDLFEIKNVIEFGGNSKECAKSLYQRYDFKPIEMPKVNVEELDSELLECKIDPTKIIEKPPVIVSIIQKLNTTDNGIITQEVDILSLGDLSLLQGKQKSKKTFFTSSLAVSLLNPKVHSKIKTNVPKDRNRIAFFDTEQSAYYAHKTSHRIYRNAENDQFDYYALRDKTPSERKQIIERYLQKEKRCSFIFIDGVVDLLHDFNDLKESTETVQWVMSITKKYNVHCMVILHENNEGGKARGHIGTMLAQKAETVIRMEKNKDDSSRSTIIAKDTRGKEFMDFDIVINENGQPYFEGRSTNNLF